VPSDLLPSFRLNHIKGLYPVFWKKGKELNATLLKEGPDVVPAKSDDKSFEIEIGAFATRATLDIIGHVLISVPHHEQKLTSGQYRRIWPRLWRTARSPC
jgi:hypothetical protein